MLDRILNGDNPYRFDDGDDHSQEIPPLELCQYLPAWDIRIMGVDDFRYEYGDVKADDDGKYNYRDQNDQDWQPSSEQQDLDGGDTNEQLDSTDTGQFEYGDIADNTYVESSALIDFDGNDESKSKDYDLNELSYMINPEDLEKFYDEDIDFEKLMDPFENPYEYLLRNIDGGDADEQLDHADTRQFEYADITDSKYVEPATLIDFDGNDESEESDYDLNEFSYIANPEDLYDEDLDFCTLLYNMPEKYANIYSVTVYCIARIFEDEIIKRTGDYLAKYEIHRNDFPEADAYINIHIGINPRMNKVYVEFVENHRLKILMGEYRNKFMQTISTKLNTFFDMTMHNHKYKIEVISPEDNNTFCCDSSQVLTCHTITYWKSLYNKYAFLEDREEVKLDIAKKSYGYNRKEFYDKVHALNREYQMNDERHSMIPEVFEKYKAMYKDEFGVELPDFYEAHIRVSCKYDVLYREDMYGKEYEYTTNIEQEENNEEAA